MPRPPLRNPGHPAPNPRSRSGPARGCVSRDTRAYIRSENVGWRKYWKGTRIRLKGREWLEDAPGILGDRRTGNGTLGRESESHRPHCAGAYRRHLAAPWLPPGMLRVVATVGPLLCSVAIYSRGHTRELEEAALAHVVAGVEGAYMRSGLFERRRRLMQAWADYLGCSGAV